MNHCARCLASNDIERRNDTKCKLHDLTNYDMVFNCPFVGFAIIKDNTFQQVNEYFCNLFGYSQLELIGHEVKIIHPTESDFNTFGELMLSMLSSNQPFQSEWMYLKKDKTPIWCDIFGHRLSNDTSLWIYLNITDNILEKIFVNKRILIDEVSQIDCDLSKEISQRKATQYALERSEEKYRELYDDALIGLYSNNFSDGRVLECNNRYAEILGYKSKEECILNSNANSNYYDMMDYDNIKQELAKNNIIQNSEVMFKKANSDEIIWVRFSAKLKQSNGLVIDGVALDITAEKQAQLKLKENEQKFKAIYDESFNAIILTDSTSLQCIDANQSALTMLQYNKTQIKDKCINELIRRPGFIERLTDDINKSTCHMINDIEFITLSGNVRYGDIYVSKISYEQHEAFCFIIQDKTSEKQLKLAIENRELELRLILESEITKFTSELKNITNSSRLNIDETAKLLDDLKHREEYVNG